MNKNKKAYTLIETMISIIIIALIIAAFAPILTKRMTKEGVSLLSKKQGEVHDLFLSFDDAQNTNSDYHECKNIQTNAKGTKTLKCKLKNINTSKVNILLAGAGGGGAGGSSYGNGETIVKEFQPELDIEDRLDINDPHMDKNSFKLTAIAPGSRGCGALYYKYFKTTKTFIDNCPNGTREVTTYEGKKYCLTEYNLGPKDLNQYENYNEYISRNLTNAIKIERENNSTVDIILNNEGDNSPKCRIASEKNCSIDIDYPGCGRSVCNWYAAKKMCENIDWGGNNCKDENGNSISCKGKWRLMTKEEIDTASLKNNILYVARFDYGQDIGNNYDKKLKLCAISTGIGFPYCNTFSENSHTIYPSYYWSSENSSNLIKTITPPKGNVIKFYNDNIKASDYASVLCVLDKAAAEITHVSHAGGGGCSGAYYENYQIPPNIIQKCIDEKQDCYFTIKMIKSGSETGRKVSSLVSKFPPIYTSGSSYGEIQIYIRNAKKEYLFQKWPTSYSANSSKSASRYSSGTGCTEADYRFECKSNNGSSCYSGSGSRSIYSSRCTTDGCIKGNYGENGISGTDDPNGSVEFKPAIGGKGGEGYEINGVMYGYGGDGGSVLSPEDTSEDMSGKAGGPGIAIIQYSQIYKGAPGGGGGGGGFIHKQDIEITPNKEYEIQIGGGGKGGAAASGEENNYIGEKGVDGGDTIVKFESLTLKAHGGKGGTSGIGETQENNERTAGLGGAGGDIEGAEVSAGRGSTRKGQSGTQGSFEGDYTAVGGLGGRSGISMSLDLIQIACGGMYFDNNIGCLNQTNHHGLGAQYLNEMMETKPKHIYKEENLGSYGAGGGGGGWKYTQDTGAGGTYGVFTGKGGDGQGGYIYLWWE